VEGASLQRRVADLIDECGLDVAPAADVVGSDPVLPTRARVGESAAVALGAVASALAEVHRMRTGRTARATVEVREAAASVMSLFHTTVDGAPLVPGTSGTDMSHSNPTVDLYRTADDRWIHLHGAFAHLAAATLGVLRCDRDRTSIAAAVAQRDAFELEEALALAGTCGAVARTSAEWARHEQGRWLHGQPPVALRTIGAAPPTPLPAAGERPLDGVRVLDFTRVIAGPTVGKLMAAHGAEVLHVTAPDLDDFPTAVIDTGHGKWSAHADLRLAGGAPAVAALLADADVVVDSARAGALARHGFGPAQLAVARPGLVVVSVNCYGAGGPWVQRPGFDHLAQTVSGLTEPSGHDGRPVLVPAPVCDTVAGYLATAGAIAALVRRWRNGGTTHVTTSLTRAAMWVDGFGRTASPAAAGYDVDDLLVTSSGPIGDVVHLRPPVRLGGVPAGWPHPTVPRGAHSLEWPSRPAPDRRSAPDLPETHRQTLPETRSPA
jgi:crotonobetainyl-CoA:carnitine CoA-transferase CaiB-like acyl-CoA transferase